MGLRPAKCYRRCKRAFTRTSKFKKDSFVKVRPPLKITKFDMGDLKKKFTNEVSLFPAGPIQIRHNAIEASRLVVGRQLTKHLGNEFFFKVNVYPHHILRENKMITGAGADRMQKGMQKAFGSSIGVAARINKKQRLFTVAVNDAHVDIAKKALLKAKPRLPGKYYVEIKKV